MVGGGEGGGLTVAYTRIVSILQFCKMDWSALTS